jgi:hypothetical protein
LKRGAGAVEEAARVERVEILRGHRAREPRVERTQKDAELLHLAHHAERLHQRFARRRATGEDFFADALARAGAVVSRTPAAAARLELRVNSAIVPDEVATRHTRRFVERERSRSIERERDATKRSAPSAIATKIVHDGSGGKRGRMLRGKKKRNIRS